jgi:ABC-type multidrug transport system fused ATPase/permease subunit
VSRINVDIGVVQENLTSSASIVIRCLIQILGCIGILFYLSPILAAILVATMIPLGFLNYFYSKK